MSNNLTNSIVSMANDYLNPLGWNKQKEDIFTKRFNDDCLYWLSLNKTVKNHGKYIAINIICGIRWQPIEMTISKLSNSKFHEYSPPTVSVPIGYLMPNNSFVTLIFEDGSDIDAEFLKLKEYISNYAMPFFDRNNSLTRLSELMHEKKFFRPQQSDYRIMVAYYLLGNFNEAINFANSYLEQLKKSDIAFFEKFELFYSELRKMAGIDK